MTRNEGSGRAGALDRLHPARANRATLTRGRRLPARRTASPGRYPAHPCDSVATPLGRGPAGEGTLRAVRALMVIEALGEGGTERSLADLLPPLVERGVEPVIATLRSRGDEGVEPE